MTLGMSIVYDTYTSATLANPGIMDETQLASLSLTHVHYSPGDPLSYLSAWLALVPQALCVVYVALIWASREAEVILMFTGQMGCEALNFVLKRIIREERPKQMFGKGYGMPSSHAQFVAFFAVYLSLFLLLRHAPIASNPQALGLAIRVMLAILLCLGAAVTAISRVYLNYHTPRQVLAGCATGVAFAVSWFLVTYLLRGYGWVDWGLDLELSRYFRTRDLIVSEDFAEAGWQRWDAAREARRRVHTEDTGSYKSD